MGESDDIVGLTFSEFAFFIVFILILLLVVGRQSAAELRTQLTQAQSKLKQTEADLARTESRVTELEEELSIRRSRQRPSCVERSLAPGFLFRVTIVSRNGYVVEGTESVKSLDQVLQMYSAEINRAELAGCVHSADVGYSQGMSIADYDRALRMLEQSFYVRRLGIVPAS